MDIVNATIIILVICGGVTLAFWLTVWHEFRREKLQVVWALGLIVIIGLISFIIHSLFIWGELWIPTKFQQQLINNEGLIIANREIQKQATGNQSIIDDCREKIKLATKDSKRILHEILKINNIDKKSDENYELNWNDGKWRLHEKLRNW